MVWYEGTMPFDWSFNFCLENEFVELKRDPEPDAIDNLEGVKAEPKEFDLEQAAADMVANDTVLIKRKVIHTN